MLASFKRRRSQASGLFGVLESAADMTNEDAPRRRESVAHEELADRLTRTQERRSSLRASMAEGSPAAATDVAATDGEAESTAPSPTKGAPVGNPVPAQGKKKIQLDDGATADELMTEATEWFLELNEMQKRDGLEDAPGYLLTHSELVDALIELLLTPDDVWNNKNRRRRHDQEVKPEQLTRLSAGLRMAQKEEKKAMRVRHPVTLPGDMLLARILHQLTTTRSREEIISLMCSLTSLYGMVLIIFYIPMAEKAMMPFACADGEDGVSRMISESASSIKCDWDDKLWPQMAMGGYVVLMVYVVGVPIMLVVVLRGGAKLASGKDYLWYKASKHAGMHDPHFEHMFGALYSSYHYHSYLWEGWTMTRKLLLVGAQARLPSYPTLQAKEPLSKPFTRDFSTPLVSDTAPRSSPDDPCHHRADDVDRIAPHIPPVRRPDRARAWHARARARARAHTHALRTRRGTGTYRSLKTSSSLPARYFT